MPSIWVSTLMYSDLVPGSKDIFRLFFKNQSKSVEAYICAIATPHPDGPEG